MSRKESNIDLLNRLEYLIEKHPDMRFSQILQNFGFVKPQRAVRDPGRISWQNEFYIEGSDLLTRVIRRIEDMESDEYQHIVKEIISEENEE